MAKRFADSDKYKKPFYRRLPAAYKLFWDFLYLNCDAAGIWIVDAEIAQKYLGDDIRIDLDTALKLFNKDEPRIAEICGGTKWFLIPFISFQYGHLSWKNKAHKSIIENLQKLNILDENLILKTDFGSLLRSPLDPPLKGDKEQDKEKEMDKDFGKSENLLSSPKLVPDMLRTFKEFFPTYPARNEEDYPACLRIAQRIAEANGWTIESITNGKMNDVLLEWRGMVAFAKTDDWLQTRSLEDFAGKEFKRLIQKMNNGSQDSRRNVTRSSKSTQGVNLAVEAGQRVIKNLAARGKDDGIT